MTLSKFVGDIKLSGVVDRHEGQDVIQRDLELGCYEPDEVQQGQVQGSAHGSGQSQTQIKAGWRMDLELP